MTRWITGSRFLRRAPDPVSRVNVPVFGPDALDAVRRKALVCHDRGHRVRFGGGDYSDFRRGSGALFAVF